MAKQRIDPERDLRAWADALNAVADLQRAIVEQAREMTLTDFEGIKWLEPYRAIVSGTIQTFPEKALGTTLLEAAEGLKSTATEALEQLRKEAQERLKGDPDCEQCHGKGCSQCRDDIYYKQEAIVEQERRDRAVDIARMRPGSEIGW